MLPGSRQAAVLPALTAFLALALILPSTSAPATDPRQPKSKYGKVKDELEKTTEELKKIEKSETVTLREIENTSRQLSSAQKEYRERKQKADEARRAMESARKETEELAERVEKGREWLRQRLRAMHRQGKYGDALLLLGSARDLPDLTLRWRYLEKLASQEQNALRKYRDSMAELRSKKAGLERAYETLKAEEERSRVSHDRLSAEIKKKEQMLMSVRREKQSYSRIEWELKREAARIKKVISQSEREKEKTYSYKGFRDGRGRLEWPVRGKVAIEFGKHNDPGLQTPVFRNGIYIAAPADTVARSVGEGKVVFADWFEGYGQLVIINHGGGYHTLYANLSEIFLSAGDIIKDKDRIGRVGTSGILDRPALYFEIRYKGKPLNPTQWLR